jgi:hypothetical protein
LLCQGGRGVDQVVAVVAQSLDSTAMTQDLRPIGGTDSRNIFKAYFWGLNFREYPHNSYGQKYGTNVPPF